MRIRSFHEVSVICNSGTINTKIGDVKEDLQIILTLSTEQGYS